MVGTLYGDQRVREAPNQKGSRSVRETLNSVVWKRQTHVWRTSEKRLGKQVKGRLDKDFEYQVKKFKFYPTVSEDLGLQRWM